MYNFLLGGVKNMKKYLIIVLSTLFMLVLTSCILDKTQYTAFEENHMKTYYEAEHKSNNRYILYYYAQNAEESNNIKDDILSFFSAFELLDFYLVDTSNIETEISSFGGYVDEPIVYVVSSNAVYESYIGSDEIHDFITTYSNIEFDYDLFESQHIESIYDLLDIENCDYIVYYYLDDCPDCIAAKPDFLSWAFTKSAEDIYFVNGSEVEAPEDFPTELIIQKSGTPLLILMSNGLFTDEYYTGTEDVLDYITQVADGDIVAKDVDLDYDDFSEFALSSYNDTLTISDNLHFEYFYSPYCSHCNGIKNTVLNFFNTVEGIEFYVINSSSASGISKIPGFSGVPALYVIHNNVVVEEYIGSVEIPAFINDYCNGQIDFSEYE